MYALLRYCHRMKLTVAECAIPIHSLFGVWSCLVPDSFARLDIVNPGQDLVLVFCSRCFTGLNVLGWFVIFVEIRQLEKFHEVSRSRICTQPMVQQRHLIFWRSGVQGLQLAVVLIQTCGGMYQERLPQVCTFSSYPYKYHFIPHVHLLDSSEKHKVGQPSDFCVPLSAATPDVQSTSFHKFSLGPATAIEIALWDR